jgi:peptidoglycan/xylan/chitin deacetylase (PgdA/CDA1 family)
MMSGGFLPMKLRLPPGVRCAIALSYDLEMCAGYAPDGINHGRIMPAVQDYTLRLCEIAERYGVKLHFFYVANGLEEVNIHYLEEILRRGHVIDSHTYSHQHVAKTDPARLDHELSLANHLLQEKLGVVSTVLRGPYGYTQGWRNLPPENRQVIMKNGFRWLSGEYDDRVYTQPYASWVRAAETGLPYQYPEGLAEIPFQGWSDRMWFDMRPEVDQKIIDAWRPAGGHRPVAPGWKAPWELPNALDDWIRLNNDTLDQLYLTGGMWVPVWHPYTHYLHDPECRTLAAFLEHAAQKPERAWVCTVRDAAQMLDPQAEKAGSQ